jgi:hypothetical protein
MEETVGRDPLWAADFSAAVPEEEAGMRTLNVERRGGTSKRKRRGGATVSRMPLRGEF